jgi:alkanesulfonate monooxygenase SsuD/methylene tetrahydromethanopterin reductase-like flavin-dependent oxidoreductase (luciferase family)
VSMQNGRPYEKPYPATRDMARFLRRALAGENANGVYDTFEVQGFRMSRKIDTPPPIFLAALRPGMLALAGREADGVILNYTAPDDYPTVVPLVKAHGADKEIVQRLYVCPTDAPEAAYARARRSIAAYLSVPTYRAHQEWLGHGDLLSEMWACAERGDMKAARAALPSEVVDRYYLIGSAEACRDRISEFVDAGLETPILTMVEEGGDPMEMARALAPR